MRRPTLPAVRADDMEPSAESGGSSATGATGNWFVKRAANRWPALVALVAAYPIGVAAADPVFNSGDLLLWAVVGLFAWGVSRG